MHELADYKFSNFPMLLKKCIKCGLIVVMDSLDDENDWFWVEDDGGGGERWSKTKPDCQHRQMERALK